MSSSARSRSVVCSEKRMPSGKSTTCRATSLPASRNLSTSAGDIPSASPVLVKPSPAAPSTGNSRVGFSVATPVRSRTEKLYSSLLSRRSTPLRVGWLIRFFRGHLAARKHVLDLHPDLGVAPEIGERLERIEIHLRLSVLSGMAVETKLVEQRPDRFGKCVIQLLCRCRP